MHAFEVVRHDPSTWQDLALRIVPDPATDQHQYNVPSVDEIAAVIASSGNDMEVNDGRDILLRKQTGGVCTAPLHYVLLFPLARPARLGHLSFCP
jgi:hypothetical protein